MKTSVCAPPLLVTLLALIESTPPQLKLQEFTTYLRNTGAQLGADG